MINQLFYDIKLLRDETDYFYLQNVKHIIPHSLRVYRIAKEFSEFSEFSSELKLKVIKVALYHDFGKFLIHDRIINKKSALSIQEWSEIKQHSYNASVLLNGKFNDPEILEAIIHHHERWDGKGYLDGLYGKNIPYLSRIIAIIDSFDAMTSNRSYKKMMSEENAIIEIERCSGSQFDPEISNQFIQYINAKNQCETLLMQYDE